MMAKTNNLTIFLNKKKRKDDIQAFYESRSNQSNKLIKKIRLDLQTTGGQTRDPST